MLILLTRFSQQGSLLSGGGQCAIHLPCGYRRIIGISRRWGWARHLHEGWPDWGPWNTSGKWTQLRAALVLVPIPDLTSPQCVHFQMLPQQLDEILWLARIYFLQTTMKLMEASGYWVIKFFQVVAEFLWHSWSDFCKHSSPTLLPEVLADKARLQPLPHTSSKYNVCIFLFFLQP